MKKHNKIRFMSIVLTLLLVVMMSVPMMAVPTKSMAAELTVGLGTTESFAVLAGSAITNTGATVINGDAGNDIGVSTGSAITGFPPGTYIGGTSHSNDASAILAQTDLGKAYVDAAGRTTTNDLTGKDLGGLTLTPGVYSFSSSAQLTGTLTLDGQNLTDPVFVFQIGSTLTTASNSEIKLINGARYCRTFWQVGSSATLGTSSYFVGHIFAMASITATTGARIQGQLLAQTGAVTLDNNIITNGFCATPPTLLVKKLVTNDNSGTKLPGNFNLYVKTSGGDAVAGPVAGTAAGTLYTLAAGTYVVSEDPDAGYTASYSGGNIVGSNSITLAPGDNKIITITNDDIAPLPSSGGGGGLSPVYPPLINVVKTPEPLALTTGAGLVTYTYKVTNPGRVTLTNVTVTDDKVSPVNYISGDTNSDNRLQADETWIYTSKVTLNATTSNTATVKGNANGMTATDIAFATVVVTQPAVVTPIPPVVTPTVTGGQLPQTSTPVVSLFLLGLVLTMAGIVGWRNRRRYE